MNEQNKLVIVFVHGILGFTVLGMPRIGLYIRYFRNLPAALRSHQQIEVHFPALPPVGSVATRAQVLADYIEGLEGDSVHLIGHSMGGLDCRYFASRLDSARRVRSVTTVATPHHGTPLADWIVEGKGFFPTLAGWVLGAGIVDMTAESCRRFNEDVPDRVDVRYASYAGARPISEMPPWYRPWTRMITRQAGDNDSQVPVASAQWGEFVKQVRADHLELVGWSLGLASKRKERPFEHIQLYHEIINRLIYNFC